MMKVPAANARVAQSWRGVPVGAEGAMGHGGQGGHAGADLTNVIAGSVGSPRTRVIRGLVPVECESVSATPVTAGTRWLRWREPFRRDPCCVQFLGGLCNPNSPCSLP